MSTYDTLATVIASPVGVVLENRTLIIQLLLILGIIVITAWLFITRGARQLAIRRLIILAFAVFAVLAVLFPNAVTVVARFVGVGRGTDLLLYATVIVLFGFLALHEARSKATEKRTTKLARKVAVYEAESPEAYRNHALAPTNEP